jgi:hypothetical protein
VALKWRTRLRLWADHEEALTSRRLNLAHMRRIYLEVADRAEQETWSYRDFLALLLAELQSTLRQSLLDSYLGVDFVTEGPVVNPALRSEMAENRIPW